MCHIVARPDETESVVGQVLASAAPERSKSWGPGKRTEIGAAMETFGCRSSGGTREPRATGDSTVHLAQRRPFREGDSRSQAVEVAIIGGALRRSRHATGRSLRQRLRSNCSYLRGFMTARPDSSFVPPDDLHPDRFGHGRSYLQHAGPERTRSASATVYSDHPVSPTVAGLSRVPHSAGAVASCDTALSSSLRSRTLS